MHLRNVLLVTPLLTVCLSSNAQTFVPPNMDFETGTTANWTFYSGTVLSGHTFVIMPTTATPGLHTITSGSGTDMYGGFPVVGSGSYSLKLAHDTVDQNADAASYNIHVPTSGAYQLIYHYAAVLEDTVHLPANMPIVKVVAIDSSTGARLPDSLQVFPNSPGFLHSTVGTDVFYKSWTTDTINLAGYGGHTVVVVFAAAACGDGGHFGYGYIDVSNVALVPGSLTAPVIKNATAAMSIYPNPASDQLHVKWANQQTGNADVLITDAAGRTVSHATMNIGVTSGETSLNVSKLKGGIYSVSITSGTLNYTNQLVIQK